MQELLNKMKLTRDKVISIVAGSGDMVGVYWKGEDGRKILFEAEPKTADAIIEIWNKNERRIEVCELMKMEKKK